MKINNVCDNCGDTGFVRAHFDKRNEPKIVAELCTKHSAKNAIASSAGMEATGLPVELNTNGSTPTVKWF